MLESLKDFLQIRKGRAAAGDGRHSTSELQLAAAALMVEAAQMDGEFDGTERARIGDLLRGRFELEAGDVDSLIEAAEIRADMASGLHGFTSEIRRHFDHAERIAMVEMLWDVVYADGILHDFEANMLRRVAGLLYVTDRENGEARKRALGRRDGD
ncbi:MAG: TerB family tellurite resistance protein [Alphaproteobacteria bacterium]